MIAIGSEKPFAPSFNYEGLVGVTLHFQVESTYATFLECAKAIEVV